MRQGRSRVNYDDFNEIEDYQHFSNQKLQNFSNSRYSNVSFGIKVVSNSDNIKKSIPQNKSKIAKKTDSNVIHSYDTTREPLKTTNKQVNTKKKNNQEVKLYGSVIQKVDYPQRRTPQKPTIVEKSFNPSPKIRKSPTVMRNSSTKNNAGNNSKLTPDKSKKNKPAQDNIDKDENLQVLATKYSKFLQEKINSHQNCQLQIVKDEKSKKSVSFQQPINENKNNIQNQKPALDTKRPTLHQSTTYSVERPELQSNSNIPSPAPIKSNNAISTPQKMQKDIDLLSDTDSENDEIDSFHLIEPKAPPKPIEHIDDISTTINEPNEDQFKELLKKKNELDNRINSTIQLQQKLETDSTQLYEEDDSIFPKIEKIQSSLSSTPYSETNSPLQESKSTSKSDNIKINIDSVTDSDIVSNCNQLDPSSFVPKKRLFDISGSETDSESEFDSDKIEEKQVNQSPIKPKINNCKEEPKSPHVTWDISNCPPIRPRVSNNFGINKSFSFINYDEITGFSEETEADNKINDDNQIDFNSPVNFSRAMKLPKDFLYDISNNNDFNYAEDEDNLLYENEEEDAAETVPNFSRISSILNKKLDESRYKEVVNILNQYKAKHFCLLISMPNKNVDAIYLLRADLSYAKLIWGEGLTKVYRDDVEKFFSINIASRKFEQIKTTEFVCDVDAFTVD